MKNVLISTFDMEIGGVERSLINMLSEFDYKNNNVDLMLYSHSGDFLSLLPKGFNLLPEIKEYKTFRQGIGQVFKNGFYGIGCGRVLAKVISLIKGKMNKSSEIGYYQMQLMWKYAIKYLPKLEKKYDVAISYLWPHYFVAEKVNAKKKIAWIHTDFSTIETDIEEDLRIWNKFDNIVAVSEECKNSFLNKYPSLNNKVSVIENITSPEFIKKMSEEDIEQEFINDTSFKLISVARLSHAKGIDNAVKALKILKERGLYNIKWYVVGYGGDEPMIKALIKENDLEDSFILLGKKTNPYPYMKKCDLYVQPSRYEGKAVTVVEAQILNKPVLITNYPTAKSQVKENYDGIICELSIEAIANKLEDLFYNRNILNKIERNCKITNYSNTDELEKLYKLF